MIHVDQWPMQFYPDKDGNNPASDVYRFQIDDKNGMTQWFTLPQYAETEEEGEDGVIRKVKKRIGYRRQDIKMWEVTGAGKDPKKVKLGYVWGIAPEDIRTAEEKIGGKPSKVQMALWHVWDGNKYTRVDRKVKNRPDHWKNVTDIYYKEWRVAAYKEHPDPFKDQVIPVTRVQELEAEVERLRSTVK